MKYLLPFAFLFAACAAQAGHSQRMDENRVRMLMAQAAAITHRHVESVPPVYLIDTWAAFQRVACMQYRITCGLGMAQALYIQIEGIVLVNDSILEEPLDEVIVHELVHHLQAKQHDKRDCLDREVEAYKAQAVFSQIYIDALQRAVGSCTL